MPRSRTTKRRLSTGTPLERVLPRELPEITVVDQFDALLGVHALFVLVPRAEVVYFRLVVESWEDFAVVRTMQGFSGVEPGRQVVVVMAVPDFIDPCTRALARLCAEVEGTQVLSTPELRAALRRDLLDPQTPEP